MRAPKALTEGEPIAAILTFMDPLHWHRDLQITVDALRGTTPTSSKPRGMDNEPPQQVPIYFRCVVQRNVTPFRVVPARVHKTHFTSLCNTI
jgi:hypothetical protein